MEKREGILPERNRQKISVTLNSCTTGKRREEQKGSIR